jgi:hypothetical protein
MNLKTMNTKSIATIATLVLLPIAAFAQPTPPPPPPPPGPPNAPIPPNGDRDRKEKKVPVTYLGVETSNVPRVVSEQLGLAKGFGLVVDYVVPDGPAAAAGIQQSDILKMLNDQILTERDQLSKLVRSFSEGTTVTLTVLRKGKEEKIGVKLSKKEISERGDWGHGHPHFNFNWNGEDFDMDDLKEQMSHLKEQIGDQTQGVIHDAVMAAQAEAQRARDEAQRRRDLAQQQRDMAQQQRDKMHEMRDRMRDAAQRVRDEAERARENAQRAAGNITVTTNGQNGSLSTTKIDIGKAQIVYSDDKGELRVEKVDGKKVLTAKDPKGLLQFSGPVETKEDLDKVPADVRQRYDKLQTDELPAVISQGPEIDSDQDGDVDDEDSDEAEIQSMNQISTKHLGNTVSFIKL